MPGQQVGLVGLAVMGANLSLNIRHHGFSVAVYNRTYARTREFIEGPASGSGIVPTDSVEGFIEALERPRRIIVMVQAGSGTDAVIDQLLPHLTPGDVLMDGGNAYYKDTIRRSAALSAKGINFFGTGISGGEEGALHGPSIMPGGDRDAYERLLAPILTAIAARSHAGPAVTYIGPGGAGHYVKMVHNGIEYGDMQLIAEAYAILGGVLGLSPNEQAAIFEEWNKGDLDSYLIEITHKVLAYLDPETSKPLVDVILDAAGQKGTGKWASQDALDLGVPIPTIDAAVWGRNISAFKQERVAASKVLRGPTNPQVNRQGLVDAVRDALYAAKITSYAQGMALLRTASDDYGFGLDLAEIARIWMAGCIIRAKLLDKIRAAFTTDPHLVNLLVDPAFASTIDGLQDNWRRVIQAARATGVPCPAMSASLDYFDSYRSARLPANLIQGQRDFFGAHTYKRMDREGTFHTKWE
jgi:6-phosphogluconate dehydrogenase